MKQEREEEGGRRVWSSSLFRSTFHNYMLHVALFMVVFIKNGPVLQYRVTLEL
jgi:hypothetical protein